GGLLAGSVAGAQAAHDAGRRGGSRGGVKRKAGRRLERRASGLGPRSCAKLPTMKLRIRQIALVAEQLEPVLDDLRAVLGIDVCYRDPGVARFGLENALLPVGNQFLEVVAPTEEGTAGGRYLERRGGDGGYMVITQCDDHAPRRKRVEELGIRIVTQFEVPGHFRNMQLHPKDTGGSFFEIDQEVGEHANDEDGPWDPAGGADWKAGQRLDVVTGITAAEI